MIQRSLLGRQEMIETKGEANENIEKPETNTNGDIFHGLQHFTHHLGCLDSLKNSQTD